MTASIIEGAGVAPAPTRFGRFAGLRALFRKDTREWIRGKRAWVVFIVTAAFMVLTAANSWITSQIAHALPGEIPADKMGSLQAGREANVVIWDGDPFELSTRVVQVFVRGRQSTTPSREQLLVERYRQKP